MSDTLPPLGSAVNVLLVEDEAAHAELVRRAFEPYGGRFLVSVASNVAEARHTIDDRRPDLVLSDWKLPDGLGTDLLPDGDAVIPIVVMTSQGDEQTAVEVMKAGALDYVVKSESVFEELPRVVDRALREWRLIRERTRSRQRLHAQHECTSLLAAAGTVAEAIPRVLEQAGVHLEARRAEFWVPHLAGEIRREFVWEASADASDDASTSIEAIGEGEAGTLWEPSDKCLHRGPRCSRLIATPGGDAVGLLVLRGASDAWAGDPELCDFVATLSDQLSVFFQRCRLQDELLEKGKLAALGTAAAMFAHEVGNPLNNMFLQAQLLERRLRTAPEDDPLRVGLGSIVSEIRRLNVLLQEFRSLARKRPLRFEKLDLRAILSEIVELHVPGHAIEVRWNLPDDLPRVLADRDKLVQVFLNLCKNAVEVMSDGGILEIDGRVVDSGVEVAVSDTGGGLPEGIDVFELFKTTKTQGTGLGLPVVRQIVTAHGGSVEGRNRPQGGATFRVALPLSPPPSA